MATILVGNDNDVVLKNYQLADDDSDIEDAELTFTVYHTDGVTAVSGLSDVSMPYTGSDGTYRGLLPGTAGITLTANGAKYKVVVEASNYNDRWEIWVTATIRSS